MKDVKDSLSPRERSLFNARIDLGRIDVARRHISRVQNADNKMNMSRCKSFVFMKENFFETKKEHIRSVPFSSLVYDEVHSLVNEGKYGEMVVVREKDFPGNLWDLFDEFMVVVLRVRKMHGTKRAISFASSGRNFVELGFGNSEELPVSYYHDCDNLAVLYGCMSSEDLAERTDFQNRFHFDLESGRLWQCEGCGFQFVAVDIPVDRLLAWHDRCSSEGGGTYGKD